MHPGEKLLIHDPGSSSPKVVTHGAYLGAKAFGPDKYGEFWPERRQVSSPFSSSLLLSSLKLSDTKVFEPDIRALLNTVSHFFETVLSLLLNRFAPNGGVCGFCFERFVTRSALQKALKLIA